MSFIHEHNHSTKERNRKKSTWHKSLKPLYKDIKHGQHKQLQKLLQSHQETLKELDPEGTVLMHAVVENYLDMVDLLLNNNTPIYCDRESGLSPLHYAVKHNKTKVIDIFIKYNASLDKPTMYEKKTALHIAVKQKNEDLVLMLLIHGANPDVPDIYGCTPLHNSVYLGFEAIAVLLLKYEASVNCSDNVGWRPLHHAAASDQAHIVKVLLQYKANSSAQTKYGKTALHIACEKSNLTSVEVLTNSDACTTIKDLHGKVPLDYAKTELIKSLILEPDEPENTHVQHINMQIKSKSLIDLLDEEYLNAGYHSEESHTSHLTDETKSSPQRNRKISLASLVHGLVQNVQKKRNKHIYHHENLALCKSIPEEVSMDTQSLGSAVIVSTDREDTVTVHASNISTPKPTSAHTVVQHDEHASHTSTPKPTSTHTVVQHTAHIDEESHSNDSESNEVDRHITDSNSVCSEPLERISDHWEATNIVAVSQDSNASARNPQHLDNLNTRVEPQIKDSSQPTSNQLPTLETECNDPVKLTHDHLDSCIVSIAHVLNEIDALPEHYSSKQIESLKVYLQEWTQNTNQFRDYLKSTYHESNENAITKM